MWIDLSAVKDMTNNLTRIRYFFFCFSQTNENRFRNNEFTIAQNRRMSMKSNQAIDERRERANVCSGLMSCKVISDGIHRSHWKKRLLRINDRTVFFFLFAKLFCLFGWCFFFPQFRDTIVWDVQTEERKEEKKTLNVLD